MPESKQPEQHSGRVYYNKLVRDGIKTKIEKNGEACEIRVIKDAAEFEQELLKKVIEEAGALARATSRAEFIAEYADLMVVLDALTAELEIAPAEIQIALKENIEKKGLYTLRHFLHWSEAGKYHGNETPEGVAK